MRCRRPLYEKVIILCWLVVIGPRVAPPAYAQGLAINASGPKPSDDSPGVPTERPVTPASPKPQNNSEGAIQGKAHDGLQPGSYIFPSPDGRRKHFKEDVIGPGAFTAPLFQAIVDQTHLLKGGNPFNEYGGYATHPPHGAISEWRVGVDGLSKRYASRFGMGLVGTTSRYALGELLHEDVSYHPCQCHGILPRAFHVLTASFIARTRSGKMIPSLPAFVSPFIAAEVATATWYPARYHVSDALRTSTLLYFSVPVKNLVKELENR